MYVFSTAMSPLCRCFRWKLSAWKFAPLLVPNPHNRITSISCYRFSSSSMHMHTSFWLASADSKHSTIVPLVVPNPPLGIRSYIHTFPHTDGEHNQTNRVDIFSLPLEWPEHRYFTSQQKHWTQDVPDVKSLTIFLCSIPTHV